MSRLTAICRNLAVPWFTPLLKQVVLCRALVAAVTVLGAGHLLGYVLWPCVFASVTGLPCPGCGMTRAVGALVRAEWSEAMRFHPFAPGFVLFGTVMAFCALAPGRIRNAVVRTIGRFESATRLPTIFLFAAVIYGLLRMGGICSNHAVVKPTPLRPSFQERWSGGR